MGESLKAQVRRPTRKFHCVIARKNGCGISMPAAVCFYMYIVDGVYIKAARWGAACAYGAEIRFVTEFPYLCPA